MPATSRFMMAYGLLLIACAVVGWLVPACEAARPGLVLGIAMITFGAAAAQGRTSLRKTGLYLGILLAMLSWAYFGWRAIESWRAGSGFVATLMLTVMSGAGLATLLILMKLRVGDSIGERGYSVLPMSPRSPSPPHSAPHERIREP